MKSSILFAAVISFLLVSCKEKKTTEVGTVKSPADSLMELVMEGHDAGMAKYGKMQGLKKQVDAALDSISKLPAKAKEASAPYEQNLKEAGTDLANALAQMDNWMETFNMDSALNDAEKRIRYLSEEKNKVGKVKELILQSVAKADSLLRK